MKILFIGDIFGSPGRNLMKKYLPDLRKENDIDFCIANGENVAHGKGITQKTANELFNCGVDCFTSGNHIWDKKDSIEFLKEEPRILKPLNYHEDAVGAILYIANIRNSKLAVVNLAGQVYMNPINSPFTALENILPKIKKITHNIFVDFHAEATAEKKSLALHFDGRISALVGTHTHVQTADEDILPNKTAYITDVGMTGPHDSCIGIDKDIAIRRMITAMPQQFKPAMGGLQINAVVVEIDENTGNAVKIERILRKYDE